MSAGKLISYHVQADDEGMRIDAFCSEKGFYPSRNNAVRAIDAGKVLVNGNPVAKRYVLNAGDTLVYELQAEENRAALASIEIPLTVKYEDEYLAVISKQAGLVVHPASNFEGPTLVHALMYKYGRENLAHIQGDDRPGIVHRLDGDTSGLLIIAKNDEVGFVLQDQIRSRAVDRRYLALVHGRIAPDTGMIDAPIARHERDRLKMTVSNRAGARSAVTTFTTVERFEAESKDEGYTLVECKLHSGRTHQIRVHMNYINHAIVGDQTYGHGPASIQLGLHRQFLHSYHLSFNHPVTDEYIDIIDELPNDLIDAYDTVKKRSLGRTEQGIQLRIE